MTDQEYLKLAYEVAAKQSTDPSTQNGAVLVIDGEVKIGAANHFPKGVQETEERWKRPEKYLRVEHAERNSIYFAARKGIKTEGAVMYACWAACADCARAIIQSGIKELVSHDCALHKEQVGWKESIEVADGMLTEGGVKVRRITGKFGKKIRFNGKVVEV